MTRDASPEQVRHVVQAASLAPSVHNTQPWRFSASAGHLELRADSDRTLAVVDPEGRQLHLSCGAALLHARVAARAIGLDASVRLLPRPDVLAELSLTEGRPAADDEVRLALAILQRRTHRGAFDDRCLPESLLEQLRADVEREGALLQQVVDPDELIELEVLLSHADAQEEADEGYRAEIRQWVRMHDGAVDGLPSRLAVSADGSSLRQRDFTLSRPERLDGTAPAPDHPAVVVLASSEDGPLSWLRAGQALGALLLRAADQGVQAQPLGQVTDLLAIRLRLRGALHLVAVPQLVLRMGYVTRQDVSSVTPRRPVEDVLTTVPQ